jgi:hypothetical protein
VIRGAYLGELIGCSNKDDILVLGHEPGKTSMEELDLGGRVGSSQFGELGWWL